MYADIEARQRWMQRRENMTRSEKIISSRVEMFIANNRLETEEQARELFADPGWYLNINNIGLKTALELESLFNIKRPHRRRSLTHVPLEELEAELARRKESS